MTQLDIIINDSLTYTDDDQCVSRFLDTFSLIRKAKVKSGINVSNLNAHNNQVRIIPAIRFGCNGTIVRVSFAAEPIETTLMPTSHTELHVWYNFFGLYNQRSKVSLEGATTASNLNVFEKSFSQPLRFEAGDVLGLYLPDDGHTPLKLFFRNGLLARGVPSYSIQQSNLFTFFNTNNPSVETDFDAPLLGMDISKLVMY